MFSKALSFSLLAAIVAQVAAQAPVPTPLAKRLVGELDLFKRDMVATWRSWDWKRANLNRFPILTHSSKTGSSSRTPSGTSSTSSSTNRYSRCFRRHWGQSLSNWRLSIISLRRSSRASLFHRRLVPRNLLSWPISSVCCQCWDLLGIFARCSDLISFVSATFQKRETSPVSKRYAVNKTSDTFYSSDFSTLQSLFLSNRVDPNFSSIAANFSSAYVSGKFLATIAFLPVFVSLTDFFSFLTSKS